MREAVGDEGYSALRWMRYNNALRWTRYNSVFVRKRRV